MSVTPIVALDVPTVREALGIVDMLGDSCQFYKVGSELFTAAGPGAIWLDNRAGQPFDLSGDLEGAAGRLHLAAPGAPPPGTPQAGQGGGQTPGARANNPSVPTFLGANVEKPVSFPVGGLTGRRDVYVVFRNESEANSLFLVVGVDFRRSGAPVAEGR